MTRISLIDKRGFEKRSVALSDEDATVEANARAAIALIESVGALSEGEMVCVTSE